MQNNIDLREINRLLREVLKLKEENIRLQQIIDEYEVDEKWRYTTLPHGEKGAVWMIKMPEWLKIQYNAQYN